MTITLTLDEHPEGTLLTARHAGLPEDRGEVQGWTESLDRLATRWPFLIPRTTGGSP